MWISALAALALAVPDLPTLIKLTEARYNSIRTLECGFEQRELFGNRARRVESGKLSLRKPGRMRWEYEHPSGKLFLSDGKNIYYFNPATNRAERSRLKETDDFRAPLAFLLGRLDFRKDFKDLTLRQENGRNWVSAIPKSDRLPYERVEFGLSDLGLIEALLVVNRDGTSMDFHFPDQVFNPSVADSKFRFELPPGAELVAVETP